jgi:hypothetical protein
VLGVIDEHLQAQGLQRRIVVRSVALRADPADGGRQPAGADHRPAVLQRYIDTLPVRIVRCPVDFPPLTYYQLWHDLTHASAGGALAARAGARRGPQAVGAAGMKSRDPGATCSISPATRPGATAASPHVRWRPDHWLLVGDDGRIAGVQPDAPGTGPGWQPSTTAAGC